MDIQMPVMDGLEATKKIRLYEKEHDLKPILIFALSAYALKEEKDKSLNAGCNLHLSKPIKKADLIAAIKNHLETPVPNQVYTATIDPDIKEMAMTYLEQRRQEVSLLKKYLEEKDFKNLNILGHKMRGVAESYGFAELTQYGGELELAAKASQDLEIKDIITKIELYLVNVKITDGVYE
jgi:DNA-binding response OmpR family regulator